MLKLSKYTSEQFKEKLHEIIFETDTKAGKLFDLILFIIILVSLLTIILESIPSFGARHKTILHILEWFYTIVFTIEYFLRVYCVKKPLRYVFSFYGVIDFISFIPTYFSIFVTGTQYLLAIRAFRLIRIFRVFKLGKLLWQGQVLMASIRSSLPKITVFLVFILILVIILASIMYVIEGAANSGFSSIPKSMYWTIVTLTTVGYGDITPRTDFGQIIAAFIMLMGYAIIAVPTGIVTSEIINKSKAKQESSQIVDQACRYCSKDGHDYDALYCKYCGERLKGSEI